MSKTTGKRGFVAPQPAAAISTLDFAAQASAYVTSRAMIDALPEDDDAAVHAAVTRMQSAQDTLIATPALNASQIGEKINALYHRWAGERSDDLSDAATQQQIRDMGDPPRGTEGDAAQCLLLLYLDVTREQFEPETTWEGVMARVRAVRARIDAWEAEAPEDGDDDRLFPSDLRDERQAAEQAMLEEVPPHWLAVREKALLLRPFACEEMDDDYVIRTDVGGLEGHLGRLLEATAEIGDCDPADAPDLLVLKACLYAEGVARAALSDKRSGYPAYAVNPRAISEMSAIIGALQEDARLLSHSVRHDRASVIAINEVWFPKSRSEIGTVAA